jgi:MYXO-CTERM domain-containing protein
MRLSALLLAMAGTSLAASVVSASVVARIEIIADVNGTQVGQPLEWDVALPGPSGSGGWGSCTAANPSPIYITQPNQSYLDWVAAGSNPDNVPLDADPGIAVHGVQFSWQHDPVVTATFNVSSGITNSSFTINSSILDFSSISDAVGRATAAITVTDSATFGARGSVSLAGLYGGKAYAALYNTTSDTFVNLLTGGTVTVPQGTTYSFSEATALYSDPNYLPVGTSVDEIKSQFKFTLSAGDRAAGTSAFEIIPAPGAATLLGLGGLLAARRRRA